MADIEVRAPANEEGTRATVLRWHKRAGESVVRDEALLELETDKVSVEVASPATGRVSDILKQAEEEVRAGELLARIVTASDDGVPDPVPATTPETATVATQVGGGAASVIEAAGATGAAGAAQRLSPAVRRLLEEHALRPEELSGSGRGGRITAADVLRRSNEPPPVRPGLAPHSPIRRRVAEHMVRSLAAAPHVTTVFEADFTRVQAHRAAHAADFERRGERLTLTAYIVAACAASLAAHPTVNSTYREEGLELHADANIGIGTALGNEGLIAPVIRAAQGLKLGQIAVRLGQLVAAARAGTLTREDVGGGTFTISNHGVSGSLLAAPIVINQPQVAILGVGKVERRVCVLRAAGVESIAIRSLCYLTLTIDHRALDAFQANAFMSRLVSILETWDAPP